MGFASRLLAGESTERRRVSNNSSAVAQSMALQAAQRFLHNQAVDSILADQLDRLSSLKLRGSTNEYLSHVMFIVSNMFVVPNVLPAAEPVLTAVTLGPSDPLVPLQQQRGLRHISCGPRSEGGKRMALLRVMTEMFYAPQYLRLACPHQHMLHQYRKAQRMAAGDGMSQTEGSRTLPPIQQQQGSADSQQQERSEREKAVYMAAKCDAERLMLCDWVPAESLAGPELWWGWHQELTGLMCCDVCSVYVNSTQVRGCLALNSTNGLLFQQCCWLGSSQNAAVFPVVRMLTGICVTAVLYCAVLCCDVMCCICLLQDRYTCADCEGPLYCSRACYEGDKQHKTICDKLQAVTQVRCKCKDRQLDGVLLCLLHA